MMAGVQPAIGRTRRVWAFWAACAIAAVGGVVPLVLTGTTGRASGVIYPFWFAALALAACAILENRGRLLATVLYLVGALAIVYGILGMFALLIQMTVMSPCPPAPAPCGIGYARPLTSSESASIDSAMVIGMLAVVFGFAGLLANWRQHRTQPTSFAPPPRRAPAQPAHDPEPQAPAQDTPSTTDGADE